MSCQSNRDRDTKEHKRQELLKASSKQKLPFLPGHKLKSPLSHLGFKARSTLMPKVGQSLFTQNTDEKGSITHSTQSGLVQTARLQSTDQHIAFFQLFINVFTFKKLNLIKGTCREHTSHSHNQPFVNSLAFK